jgi:hypothetical protein
MHAAKLLSCAVAMHADDSWELHMVVDWSVNKRLSFTMHFCCAQRRRVTCRTDLQELAGQAGSEDPARRKVQACLELNHTKASKEARRRLAGDSSNIESYDGGQAKLHRVLTHCAPCHTELPNE